MSMQLHLGGYLHTFDAQERADMVVQIAGKQPLKAILSTLGVPTEEVYLVSINGQAVELDEAAVLPGDVVKLYPPMGGG